MKLTIEWFSVRGYRTLKIEMKTISSLNLSLYRMTYFLVDVPREGELQSGLRLILPRY